MINPAVPLSSWIHKCTTNRSRDAMFRWLAGHSKETIDGHAQFMQGTRSFNGYNGLYGYRRNTPWLRTSASPFGTASASPTHWTCSRACAWRSQAFPPSRGAVLCQMTGLISRMCQGGELCLALGHCRAALSHWCCIDNVRGGGSGGDTATIECRTSVGTSKCKLVIINQD